MSASELKERQTIELKKENISSNATLTRNEFAMWYKKIGEIESGGYVDTLENGNMLVRVNNKIAITSGTYEDPKLIRVIEFSDEDSLSDYIEYMRGKIKWR
jgi:hypothetical protein